MKFDKSKVYSAVNADEVKVGSKGYFSNSFVKLKSQVEKNEPILRLVQIVDLNFFTDPFPFRRDDKDGNRYAFFYLVEEPKEQKYRPYNDTNEMIEDFIERYNSYSGASNTHNPMYNPLIWVKEKDRETLVTSFIEDGVYMYSYGYLSLEYLFKYCTYLDGSPCGKLEK